MDHDAFSFMWWAQTEKSATVWSKTNITWFDNGFNNFKSKTSDKFSEVPESRKKPQKVKR